MQLTTKTVEPIWIVKTRSFWLGIFPAVLTLFDALYQSTQGDAAAAPIAGAVAWALSLILDVSAEQVHAVMVQLAPIYALIVAHQRRGINRPYVGTPAGETDGPVTVAVKGVERGAKAIAAAAAVQAVGAVTGR